jgi:serine/threonine-protein kinase RsbW
MGALQVRHEPASGAFVRKRLGADLGERGLSRDSIDVVMLVATELVGNAIRHAAPSSSGLLDVEWDLDGDMVTVRVGDSSAQFPERRRPSAREPNGRGLAIVEALSESWGANTINAGKQVWARVAVQRDSERTSQLI